MKFEEQTGWGELDAARVALHMDGPGLEIEGRKLVPDKYRGYLEFQLAHPYPVVTSRQKTLHAGTVAKSWRSMLHQGLNFEHRVRRYFVQDGVENAPPDRYIGSILHVEFPSAPSGGWRVGDLLSGKMPMPGIRCVAVVHKQAQGVDRFLGEHQSGKHTWTVSLEVEHYLKDSGVIIEVGEEGMGDLFRKMVEGQGEERGVMEGLREGLELELQGKGKLPKSMAEHCAKFTPADFLEAGCLYVPVPEAPDEMEGCFDGKQGQFVKPFYGHRLVLAMGGLDAEVQFMGTGVVRYGAEPTAVMGRVVASDWDGFGECLERLGRVWAGGSEGAKK